MQKIPHVLDVRGLSLEAGRTGIRILRNISFDVRPGEIVGIVGESGSGKSMAARAVMGLNPPEIRQTAGAINFEGRDVGILAKRDLRALRGARIGMVFQEPMTSLNPSMTIGQQLEEGLRLHVKTTRQDRQDRILQILDQIGLTDPKAALAAMPHHFSGGMRQRIMLASVMLLKPALLIADEPTTALDAVIQRDVLELMVSLTRESNTAVLMISHDLAMVASYSDRVVVMAQGEVVEQGATSQLLAAPRHPYTQKLLSALPRRAAARVIPAASVPRVEVRGLVVDYPGRGGLLRRGAPKRALNGIDLSVQPGEILAVVGGSGSGKTTLGRTIAGLIAPTAGEIRFNGAPVGTARTSDRAYRLNCQMVFQDPYSSLDPRMTIGALVAEALRHTPGLSAQARHARVGEALDEVGLSADFAPRYPHQLSGGQRQRVAIARAIAARPQFVIADEPVSALDVTVRAQVLHLFADLQRRHGFSCLFISHDLAVVEQIADRVVVMAQGRVIEQGSRDAIFDTPREGYTRDLLRAIPTLFPTEQGGVRPGWRLASGA
ncbi:peptide/nickel transport system ATP-binding protein [Gemmobacter megaterium]|uniref:Peptide/nickel transport system ATP-binding protein n=1 Tax=Gemmobacter megaterium TaxID=1086013 RepID=A0A1N7N244_9RHOB|nr:ABC transporter ATP-binding protein [Gemmobacter megaterium]GGE12590.1 peptide ABC transporter ATP-binding protein [Gemmobacter megaterium]SIS92402.1 peptide/nickel transport system ATP-binding protein [Gemmobacter megaterium]